LRCSATSESSNRAASRILKTEPAALQALLLFQANLARSTDGPVKEAFDSRRNAHTAEQYVPQGSDVTPRQVTPAQNDFEDLSVNNQYMSKVEAYLNRFNPITMMRMERMEIRHSAILAWLLDPRETHGLQDKFLRTFLCEAMRGQGHMDSPTALEISQADLRDADVRREWQSIDIFILLPRLNWVFIIEKKFQSNQNEGQLAKYADRVSAALRQPRR
jgi:hypothetical protein